ncbi:hypothetical protein NPX13_g5534 [Xylaria arbuscula]|uniref:Uncharacterized protein n=1 Tax=Xylaria arbuscula TaxID=114810 RepID=A0A9W8NEN1_9PEZI|nr:hypothetical protein NPX13_g5534 [Xylaria arbuscula]
MSAHQLREPDPAIQESNNRSRHFAFQQNIFSGSKPIPGQITNIIRAFQRDAKVGCHNAGLCIVIEDIDSSLAHTLAGIMLVDSITADLEFDTGDTYNGRVQNFKMQQTSYRKFRVDRFELPSTGSAPQNHQDPPRYTPPTMLDEVSSIVKRISTDSWKYDTSLIQIAEGAFSIIIDEWMIYTLLMGRCVKLYEPSLLVMGETLIHAKMDKTFAELFRWRRRSQQSLNKLQALRYLIEDPPNIYGKSDVLIKDLDFITCRIEQSRNLLEAMVPICTTAIELADSTRAMHEAVYVKNLTYIALVFLPLNFVSSLLSMNAEFAVNSAKFWVYWLAAVPLLIAVLTVSHFAPLEVQWRRLLLRSRPG